MEQTDTSKEARVLLLAHNALPPVVLAGVSVHSLLLCGRQDRKSRRLESTECGCCEDGTKRRSRHLRCGRAVNDALHLQMVAACGCQRSSVALCDWIDHQLDLALSNTGGGDIRSWSNQRKVQT